MKRRHLIPIVTLLLAVVPAPAELDAQAAGDEALFIPSLGGGLGMGVGDLATDTDPGWLAIAGVDFPLSSIQPGLAAGLVGILTRLPYGGGFGEATFVTAVTLEAAYRFGAPTASLRPYLRAGGGVQIHRYDPGELLTPAVTDTRPALGAGAGVEIAMGAANAVLGARFGSGTDAGFFGAHAGVSVPVGLSR